MPTNLREYLAEFEPLVTYFTIRSPRSTDPLKLLRA